MLAILIFVFSILAGITSYSQAPVNNLVLPEGLRTSQNGKLGKIIQSGRGKIPVILIADIGFDESIYDPFILDNQSKYTMYTVTLPGSVATDPPAMPATGTSYGARNWLKNAEEALLHFIDSAKLNKPIIIGNMVTASWLTLNMASKHPDQIGKAIIISGMPFATWPSWKDSTGKTPIRLNERASSIDRYMAPVVFKSISGEAWERNLFQPQQYSNDTAIANKFYRSAASTPIPVMVRYLCEYYTTDISEEFSTINVPVLVLIPGFNEDYFQKYARFKDKEYFWTPWEKARPYPSFRIETIANARFFILSDQFEQVNTMINKFISK